MPSEQSTTINSRWGEAKRARARRVLAAELSYRIAVYERLRRRRPLNKQQEGALTDLRENLAALLGK